MSVSSMNVETGSIASASERDGNANEADRTPPLASFEPNALSDVDNLESHTPDLTSLAPPTSAASIASSSDDSPGALSSLPATKGPLEHLRQPSRSGSIASMSSLVVEAPPDDVADLEAMSAGRPSLASEAETEEQSPITPMLTDDVNEHDEGDEQRLERTNQELRKYENDQQDPTAHGSGPEEEGGLPVRPTWDAEDDATAMPKVKCSDCDASVDLVELADHSCNPARQSLTSPQARNSSEPRDSTLPGTESADGTVGPKAPSDLNEDAARTPLAGSAILDSSISAADIPREEDTSAKLDEYVPQTRSVVPEDVAPDGPEEEDVLDFYGEDSTSDAANEESAASRPVQADVPVDLDETENQPEAPNTLLSPSMSRSLSQPTSRPPKDSGRAPRSHSVYLPGHYSEDDDEGYQGGTVTIVQSSR